MATRWPISAKNKVMEQTRDILFMAAAKFCIEKKAASESALQLHFGIGYYRASTLMSELEEAGLVGPPMGTEPRIVLFDSMLDFVRSLPKDDEEIRDAVLEEAYDLTNADIHALTV